MPCGVKAGILLRAGSCIPMLGHAAGPASLVAAEPLATRRRGCVREGAREEMGACQHAAARAHSGVHDSDSWARGSPRPRPFQHTQNTRKHTNTGVTLSANRFSPAPDAVQMRDAEKLMAPVCAD